MARSSWDRGPGARPLDAGRLAGSLLDQIRDALYVIDVETAALLDVNEAACEMLGYTRDELLDMTLHEVSVGVPDAPSWEEVVALLHEGGGLLVEVEHRRKDASLVPVEVNAQLTQDQDRDVVVAVMRDVSERKQVEEELRVSEERLRQLAEHVDELFWIVGSDGRTVEYLSPAFQTLYGLPAEVLAEEDGIQRWLQVIHPDDREAVADLIAIDAPRVVRSLTYRVQHPEGTKSIETHVHPLLDDDGELVRVVGVSRDVTTEREAEALREQALRQELELEHMRGMDAFKTRFLNTAAHELSTPLTPIKFQLEAMRAGMFGDLSAPQQESMEVLARNLERFSRLVGDLLDTTRLEAGTLKMSMDPTDVSDLVERVGSSFLETATEKSIEIAVDVDAGLWAEVDDDRLSQVLFNLMDNAIKFTPEDGCVGLRAGEIDGRLVIEVADSGIGLTAEQLDALFQPFSQVHTDADAPRRGTGLGLYISKGIAEQMGGMLTAESPGRGQGATFTVELPCTTAAGKEGQRGP